MANYTLTSDKNVIAGTTLADTFSGTYNAFSGSDTFNSVDILDGGAGVDTLQINHFMNVAITPPDALWTGIRNIEKIVLKTTGDGAQTISTGSTFEAAFRAAGVNLTSTTSGSGAIDITMSGFTGAATLTTTSLDGAQTVVTGSGVSAVTAKSGAGALDIRGAGLQKVTAATTGAGAQTIGDNSGNGKNLVDVSAISSGGAQTIISTSTSAVKVNAKSAAGEQNITTGSGADVITATTSAELNTIITNAGNDKITVLSTSSGAYTLNGGTGNDTLYGGAGADKLIGSYGHDVLSGGSGADTMTGGNGNDLYAVTSADDVVSETNSTAATGGYDRVNSYLLAYSLGANVENGRVMSIGTAGLTGNSLNNVLYAGTGNNVLDGGAGTDLVSYYAASASVTVSLATTAMQATGGSGSDTLKNVENLTGSNYGDKLTGNAGNNALNGGTGNDILTGALGADRLTGSTGADRFDFNALAEMGLTSSTRDIITDFKTSEVDRIDLLGVDANTALTGNQAFTFIGTVSAFTGNATGQLRFDAINKILYGSTDADTAAEFAIVLTGVSSLSATDFVL